jgi:UDP-glucose:(heptosyl)LPS alpha-1,3-glucosyltransferase
VKLALMVRALTSHGGTERFVLGLARFLVAAGHAVTVHCRRVETEVPGAQVRLLPGAVGRGRLFKGMLLERAVHVREDADVVLGFVRAPGFDVFRAGGGCHAAAVQGRRIGLVDQLEIARDRRALMNARAVVFNSEMAYQDVQEHYGRPPGRVEIVRNGVDLSRFKPNATSTSLPEDTVLFVGHGFARKGLRTALAAIARVPGVRLAIAGHDRQAAGYRRFAKRLGVADRVDWLGSVDRMHALMPSARALLLPTRYDPSANVCLEAMACGVPVVTSARNGASEILPEPWQVVSDPEDAVGFANTLERVLQTPTLRSDSRAAAEDWPEARAHRALETLAGALVP